MSDSDCILLDGNRCQEKYMYKFIGYIEKKFQRHGERVAENPKMYIFLAMLSVLGLLTGFLCFRQERNPLRLWIPQESDFFTDTHWLMDEYGEGLRLQAVLITAPDVLQPSIMEQLLNIHMKLVNSSITPASWEEVCFKVPIVSFNVDEPRLRREVSTPSKSLSDIDESFNEAFFKESASTVAPAKSGPLSIQQMLTDETFDPIIFLGSHLYCSIVRNMALGCLQQNVLDLWKYDVTQVQNLTKAKIISDLNSTTFSPTLGHPMPFKSLLGGVTYNENGVIISARALLSLYMVHVNFSTVNMDEVGNEGGTADWANGPGLEWESKFLEIMLNASKSTSGMEVFYEAGRSFGDISASGMFQDMDKLFIGIVLMLIYIQVQQTQISCVESRVIPSMVGLMCVGLAFLSSCGLCSILGIPYGPVHTSLPFLLLGIGVDDMFVILSCWNSLPPSDKVLPIPQRMGLAMRHAGLSITITSVTDFVAFLIGSSTILPSLRSFCLYAAVGVFVTFVLQATLFVAALTLDQKRLEAGRNCLVPFVRHTPPKLLDAEYFSQCSYGLNFTYSKYIISKIGKIFVLLVTVMFVGFAIVGNLRIRQEFKPEWFLDQNSHLYKFLEKRNVFFPDFGNSAGVYMGQLHYSEELQKIGILVQQLNNKSDILMNVEDWWSGFHRYVNLHFKKDIRTEVLEDEDFNQYISQYLFSPAGARFQKNFRFAERLECGKPATNVTVASIDFYFRKFESSAQSVPAMNAVKDLVRNANFTTGDQFATVWAKVFANWVTDEVIAYELVRNIILAIAAVGLTTFILLGSVYASLLVLLCVLLTLVCTTGFMQFWGLTIDLVSSIALVLAVGLCVDFAAHIAYAFMSVEGTRNERAIFAVSYIGGAVLHGGATTLLALSVLVLSHSYIFTAFFKIFLLVILLGLFHGLVFLPVILSLVGPKPYPKAKRSRKDEQVDTMDMLQNLPIPEGPGK